MENAFRGGSGGASEIRTDGTIANFGARSPVGIPITQCNRTKSPARFSGKWEQGRRHAEIFGVLGGGTIQFGTQRLSA
jgi:hypothetical protein